MFQIFARSQLEAGSARDGGCQWRSFSSSGLPTSLKKIELCLLTLHCKLRFIKCSEIEIRSGDFPYCSAGKITRPNFYIRTFYEVQLTVIDWEKYRADSFVMDP